MMHENGFLKSLESTTAWNEIDNNSALEELISLQLRFWPKHEKFLRTSFESRSHRQMQTTCQTAEMIYQMIAPQFDEYVKSYQWLCNEMNTEALHFFRTGKYRFSLFSEVRDEVYGSEEYMTSYMQGLLISQLFWSNHSSVLDTYLNDFLRSLPEDSRYLEIGPGHGLFCAFAAQNTRISRVEAWDISPSSLQATRENLEKLGLSDRVELKSQDVVENVTDRIPPIFDAIVLSEVLEHLEDPHFVLKGIQQYLSPNGKIFINVPINSPARDHIYLLKTPEEARQLVEESGLRVLDMHCYPVTGYTEETARKQRLSISCVLIATATLRSS